MSAKAKFVQNPAAERLIRSATGSMAGVGLAIRKAADAVRDAARESANADAAEARSLRDALKGTRRPEERQRYLQAKAEAYALTNHAKMINAFETGGRGAEVVGHVVGDYSASAAIEFGGIDRKVRLGFDEDAQPLMLRSYGHLRRALHRGGS